MHVDWRWFSQTFIWYVQYKVNLLTLRDDYHLSMLLRLCLLGDIRIVRNTCTNEIVYAIMEVYATWNLLTNQYEEFSVDGVVITQLQPGESPKNRSIMRFRSEGW